MSARDHVGLAPEGMAEDLLDRLRAGDEAAFAALVDRYARSMLRVALMYVPSRAVAEEVVQETWLAVLEGLDRFEGRARFTTWMFRILVNRAKTRGERERRTVPFAALAAEEATGDVASVAPDRFLPADHDRWPHHWSTPPRRWEESPEHSLATAETLSLVKEAIDTLPPMQRLVISMRDLDGWDGPDVCNALGVSETNQRVLLHRARSRVRDALEAYFAT
jgi:RNA polymerase sigma-70 factor (ECF subfamily)